jgi:hypothetical protein
LLHIKAPHLRFRLRIIGIRYRCRMCRYIENLYSLANIRGVCPNTNVFRCVSVNGLQSEYSYTIIIRMCGGGIWADSKIHWHKVDDLMTSVYRHFTLLHGSFFWFEFWIILCAYVLCRLLPIFHISDFFSDILLVGRAWNSSYNL